MESTAPKVRRVEPDDAVLVERFLKGDERAFAEIYQRHVDTLAFMVSRMLGDNMELDDIVQETFVIASKKLHTLQDPTRLRPWLKRIGARLVHQTMAKRGRKRMLKRAVKWTASPASEPNAASELENLLDVLDRMPPKLVIPWMLHRVEGETLTDTAEISGQSVATVKRRLKEADAAIERRLNRDS